MIATGVAPSVRELVEQRSVMPGSMATVRTDRPAFLRPAEGNHLIGDGQ